MRNLAIIPARSGSKGLQDKNIKNLQGKPLVAYAIEAALSSKIFDTVMVSTDSEKYAAISKKYGADVPFLRSIKTASDTATTWDTVLEVIDSYETAGKHFETITVLQPTSPFRLASDIINAYETMLRNAASTVVSVCECEHSPLICNTLCDDLCMDGFLSLMDNKRRQEQKKYYRLNGAIYILDTTTLKRDHTIVYNDKCFAYIMPKERSIDIDTQFDFTIAEAIMNTTYKLGE